MTVAVSALVAFFACVIGVPLWFAFARLLGLYVVVEEGTARVYILFGKVRAVVTEPGLHCPLLMLGPAGLVVNWLGSSRVVDLRLDQAYLRSQPVNSEEGAPMGVGVWYEMRVGDPVAYLFRNADPRGSLSANVSNAAVRSLSNMRLGDMLETRHQMSRAVRSEVSPHAAEWGYALGSVYIRKVHFRDAEMMRQIESKIVNRLRQVTAAIQQDGANQVNIIRSTAEREAAVEFARAATQRPQIVGAAMEKVVQDPLTAEALFELLETQRLIDANAEITLLPPGPGESALTALLAAQAAGKH